METGLSEAGPAGGCFWSGFRPALNAPPYGRRRARRKPPQKQKTTDSSQE